MPLLLDSLFSSVAMSHFMVDLLNGSRPVLLAYLSGPLGLTNAMLGLISTLYVWTGSLTQPLFGWLTDRLGPRWLAAGGVFWQMFFFILAILAPGRSTLPLLVLASLGSASFHPSGTMQATLRGRHHFAGKETTSASFFFMFGQLGLFLGPVVAGPLLDRFGLAGLLIPAGLSLPVSLNVGRQLRHIKPVTLDPGDTVPVDPAYGRGFILALAGIASLQAWSQQNMITFVPKYLNDLGVSPAIYGLIAGLFMGGSALGNVLGGNLADRFGKLKVARLMLGLASVPLLLVSRIGWSPWLFLLVPLSGMLTGAVYSIVVVTAQRAVPGGMGLASGLTLGFIFSSGALGTLVSGPLADVWGFPIVFQMSAGLVLVAAFITLPMQRNLSFATEQRVQKETAAS